MDGAKVKNIIIALLLLVDLVLLAMLLRDRAKEAEISRQTRTQVESVFAENGIELTADVPWDREAVSCSLRRDLTEEESLVSAVLGKCSVQDLGGNILFYRSDRGEARFRGTGEFQMMPYTGQIARGGDPVDTAVSVMRKMGMETDTDSAETAAEGETVTVTLICRYNGENVYNCTVSFLFTSESLVMIDGRRPLEYAADQNTETLDAATALLHYLSEIRSEGLICSEIRSVEPGLIMSASASGEGTMTPFWRIETDVGQNYVNGLTGKIESIL